MAINTVGPFNYFVKVSAWLPNYKTVDNDFVYLCKLVLENDSMLYETKHYRQNNGLSMGNPIAPQLAIIYMHYVERKILSRITQIIFWKRYIDDCFVT